MINGWTTRDANATDMQKLTQTKIGSKTWVWNMNICIASINIVKGNHATKVTKKKRDITWVWNISVGVNKTI